MSTKPSSKAKDVLSKWIKHQNDKVKEALKPHLIKKNIIVGYDEGNTPLNHKGQIVDPQ